MVQTRSTTTDFGNTTTAPRCPGCRQRDDIISTLRQRLQQTENQLQQWRERASRNASNSSTPPSANPADAPQPNAGKQPSGRQRGGQPGHPPAHRELVPRQQLAEPPIDCLPKNCEHCDAKLAGVDPLPLPHQVTEIPPITPAVREYLRHLRAAANWLVPFGSRLASDE